jgi:RNA polymerase sigma-70 factor, ECF subfamily
MAQAGERLLAVIQEEQIMDGVYNGKQTEEIRERRDQRAMVREQMGRLPTRYRIGLILHHLQERTYEEMSDILTMPVGTIKIHLFRARHLLKERLLAQRPGVPKS